MSWGYEGWSGYGKGFKGSLPRLVGVRRYVLLGLALLLLVYGASGFFLVGPSEVGLVLRFGRHARTVGPGLAYRLPFPFEEAYKLDVLSIYTAEVGFRSVQNLGSVVYKAVPQEALMLTRDGNIVHVEAVAQYRVSDPARFLFRFLDHEAVVSQAVEAVLRYVVAANTVDEVLTVKRDEISSECARLLQELLDRYGIGVKVVNFRLQDARPPADVAQAFDDVNSAQQDRERFVNEANSYYNSVIPRAKGEAAEILARAEAYRARRVMEAEGEVSRFARILEEHRGLDPETARMKIYLETMEKVMGGAQKIVVDERLEGLLPLILPGRALSPRGEEAR